MEEVVQAPNYFKMFLDNLVQMVYLVHRYILSLDDRFSFGLSDKQLHFIVVGILGMFLLFVVYPWFKYLVEKNRLSIVAWIYVFTILIAITLLIEIGQGVSGTGDMDFDDIMAGLLGFILMSGIYFVFVIVFKKLFSSQIKKKEIDSNNK